MTSAPFCAESAVAALALRQSMVAAARRLVQLGLNRGSSGNISVRWGEHALLTPSGVGADQLLAESMVVLDQQGQVLGSGKPSSEWRFHRDILQARAEIGAVVHTHSPFASAFACLQRDIPAFHYMIALAGGNSIRCTTYALFGSQRLADLALTALLDRKACLLGNHGMIALGIDLQDAMDVAIEVESLCEQYWRALQLGEPKLLSANEMAEVLQQFKSYGRLGQAH